MTEEPLSPNTVLQNFNLRMTRACARLEQIRDSEQVMGYAESAQMYDETAIELREIRGWWHNTFLEAVGMKELQMEVY